MTFDPGLPANMMIIPDQNHPHKQTLPTRTLGRVDKVRSHKIDKNKNKNKIIPKNITLYLHIIRHVVTANHEAALL